MRIAMTRLTMTHRNRLRRTVLASVLSLVFVVALGGSVLAGELPKKGTYATAWTFSGPYTVIDLGKENSAWISHFTVTRWNTAGGDLYNNISADCIGMGGSKGKLASSGYCVFTDDDGDNIYEYWYEPDEPGKGVGVTLGGTGKYKGIRGEDKYESIFTADSPEGTFHGIGHDEGSYTITP